MYTIPKSLAKQLEDESKRDYSEVERTVVENDIKKQRRVVIGNDAPYKEKMNNLRESEHRDEGEKGAPTGAIEQRVRPKRWDVTPKEKAERLKSQENQVAKPETSIEAKEEEKEETEKPKDEFYVPIETSVSASAIVPIDPLQKAIEDTDDQTEIKVLESLIKLKTPSVRKKSLRALTELAPSTDPEMIFKHVLPLLDSEDCHVFLKLIGRLVVKLDKTIKPFTHRILMAVSPILLDEDFTLRLEAREVISNLAKVVGLASVISAMRPDISNPDDYIRNISARILAVVANTLGLVSFLPFLKAVVKSKSWQTKHTGIKIILQLCTQLGVGNGTVILPFLNQLVLILIPALSDDTLQIRTISASTLSALADTVNPYGIELFEPALEPVWVGIKRHRGRPLATFLKCLGSIIPLMTHDPNYEEYSNYYTRDLISVISREFNSQDDEMKSTVLKVLQKLPLSKQLLPNYRKELYDPLIRYFWTRRVAADNKFLHRLVVSASSDIAVKVNYLLMLEKLIPFTKDDNENLRAMAVETIGKIINAKPEELIGLGEDLEKRLVDGVLYAFQEQQQNSNNNNKIYLNGLSVVCKALGIRLKPHLNTILSVILYQIKNKTPEVRQQSALLLAAIASVIKKCTEGDNEILQKLILILYESLGEVYPDVLSAILLALDSCLESFESEELLGLTNPSIPELIPSLSPILKNRQEKVQEACIKVIGLIAKKTPEIINVREWMRICFDLLDTLKSPRKRIRIAANTTFGDIARTIGPLDVLTMLLNNLRVQQRQLRVCTAVAIGIVAEVCGPFTVLPAIMNEYRTPDNNVQNGVLKALTFVFEYIDGKMIKDYLYAITTLLQDALTDRDQVHRQTASTVVKHLALNCQDQITDQQIDVFIHFLNLLMPNIFETSPHVINRILEAIDSLKNVIGYGRYMNFIWAGLFHPAKKVRTAYWKLYNMAYIQLADAMVPYYPLQNEELEVFI